LGKGNRAIEGGSGQGVAKRTEETRVALVPSKKSITARADEQGYSIKGVETIGCR